MEDKACELGSGQTLDWVRDSRTWYGRWTM